MCGPRSAMPGPHMLHTVEMKSESRLKASANEAMAANKPWKMTSEMRMGEVTSGDLEDEVLESSVTPAAQVLVGEQLHGVGRERTEGVEGFIDVEEGIRGLLELARGVRNHQDEGTGPVRKGTVTSREVGELVQPTSGLRHERSIVLALESTAGEGAEGHDVDASREPHGRLQQPGRLQGVAQSHTLHLSGAHEERSP